MGGGGINQSSGPGLLDPLTILTLLLNVDGASSGLDADLLDGQHGAYYRDVTNVNAGTLATARGGTGVSNASGSLTFDGVTTISGGGTLALASYTLTVPATGTAALIAANNAFTGANTFTNASGIVTRQGSGQDGVTLLGRAGGASSYSVTITPTTLSASRTATLPDASIVVAGSASALTAGGLPYITTGGLLAYSASLLWDNSTGRLTVLRIGQFGDGSNTGVVQIAGAAGTTRLLQYLTGSSARWDYRANSTAESGSNAGSDFQITAYTDAGAAIDNPLTIIRAAGGLMTLARPTSFTDTTDATSLTAASVVLTGGLAIGKGAYLKTATFSLTAATTSQITLGTGSTTAAAYHRVTNTGGDTTWGVERSTGGLLVTSSSAYATVIGSVGSTDLHLFSNSVVRLTMTAAGSVVVGTAAIATNATDGFLYVAACAGTPTGTPTAVTGRVPIVVDSTNHKLYFYSGGAWRDAGP